MVCGGLIMIKWIAIVKFVISLSTQRVNTIILNQNPIKNSINVNIILSPKDIDINDVDEAFYLYIIDHNKKFDYYFVKCQFKIVFNDYQYCPYVTSKLSDLKTLIPWKSWLEEVIDGLKNKAYTFNHIAEMHLITIANKMDMSYHFYLKHNMHAVEWKLNAMIKKD